MDIWTVYQSPDDYPGKFVARRFDIRPGESRPTQDYLIAETLESLRLQMPPGLTRVPRHPNDLPTIVEVWL